MLHRRSPAGQEGDAVVAATFDRKFFEAAHHSARAALGPDARLPDISDWGQAADLSWDQVRRFWGALSELDARGDLGVQIGLRMPTETPVVSLIHFASRGEPTFGRALHILDRCIQLLFQTDGLVTAKEEREGAEVVAVRPRYGPDLRHRIAGQMTVTYLYRQLPLLVNALVCEQVHFSWPVNDPQVRDDIQSCFDAPVAFGLEPDGLIFAREVLELPLSPQPPLQALARVFDFDAEPLPADRPVIERAQARVRDRLPTVPAIELVAKDLGMSPRTLQRHLRQAGTSFRKLVDEARTSLAQRLLKSGLSVTEVAFVTGYQDLASFSRAYRRVVGKPPSRDVAG